MVCFDFRTLRSVGNCFLIAYSHFLESVDTEKIFPFVADIVFRAKCIACNFPMIIELNFGSYADSVQFSVVADASTSISFLTVCIYVFPPFIVIHDVFFKSLPVGQSCCSVFWEIS